MNFNKEPLQDIEEALEFVDMVLLPGTTIIISGPKGSGKCQLLTKIEQMMMKTASVATYTPSENVIDTTIPTATTIEDIKHVLQQTPSLLTMLSSDTRTLSMFFNAIENKLFERGQKSVITLLDSDNIQHAYEQLIMHIQTTTPTFNRKKAENHLKNHVDFIIQLGEDTDTGMTLYVVDPIWNVPSFK